MCGAELMVTPTKDQIVQRATELFFMDNPSATTPEVYELKEGGYFLTAQQELMRGESAEALSYLEEQAHDLGRRVVTEEEHTKLIDLALRLEKLKEREKRLKSGELDLEARKNILDKTQKLEKVITHREANGKILKHRKKKAKRISCFSRFYAKCRKSGTREQCRTLTKKLCRRKKRKGTMEAPLMPAAPTI